MSEWQDIATAPRNETMILAWEKDATCPYISWFWMGSWKTDSSEFNDSDRFYSSWPKPTHWVPLPEPPK